MSTPARRFTTRVAGRTRLSEHLLRLDLVGGLEEFRSTGIPDEWVGLIVPGQFQSRYYTVRRFTDAEAGGHLVLDVVVHDEGLVTGWASGDCVGDEVTITAPRGSFDPSADAGWLLLVGDLTALPAMARIADETPIPDVRIHAEVPDDLASYLPPSTSWLAPPSPGRSALAEAVESLEWPAGPGYFWMAGESAQMRAIRKHLMHERRLPAHAYDVMGYWRAVVRRQPRASDPTPGYVR